MNSFRTRSVEMMLATVMVFIGVVFILPGDTMALPHYDLMRVWVAAFPGSEPTFGALILLTGAVRWAALIINGHWYPTPPARIAGCIAGSLFWVSLSISFFDAHTPGLPAAIAWTVTAFFFENFSAYRAAVDAYSMDSFGHRRRKRVRVCS